MYFHDTESNLSSSHATVELLLEESITQLALFSGLNWVSAVESAVINMEDELKYKVRNRQNDSRAL